MESTRLTKLLTIGGKPVTNIVSDSVQLDLFSTGRATFVVVCDFEPKGIVELHLGYQVNKLAPYFMGVIESKYQAAGRWFLTCRELIGALTLPAPLAIRFATMRDVLAKLSELGIELICPDADYTTKAVPCFYHQGDGISALRQLGKVYQIPDFIFQQRTDGKVYVGSWQDSGWSRSIINDFSEHPIKSTSSTKGELIVIPKLRPGLKLNGRYITETTLVGTKQVIRWSKTLFVA